MIAPSSRGAFLAALVAMASATASEPVRAEAFVVLADVSSSNRPDEKATFCAAATPVVAELATLAERGGGRPIDVVLRTVGAHEERPTIRRTRAVGTGTRSAKRVGTDVARWLCSLAAMVDRGKVAASARETALYSAIDEVAREDLKPAGGGTLVMVTDGVNHSAISKGEANLRLGVLPKFPEPPSMPNVRIVALGLGRGVPEKLDARFRDAWMRYAEKAGAEFAARRNY